jgi:outer membrane protein assembly factor BamB
MKMTGRQKSDSLAVGDFGFESIPRVCIRCFVVALLCCAGSSMLSAQTRTDSGIADIDQIRESVQMTPTDGSNLLSRRPALIRWWRFLWHQGYDTSAHNEIWNLVNNGGNHRGAMIAVDQGYAALESILLNASRIPEVHGSPDPSSTQTDWPVYHGTDGSQTGYSPDKGPSAGKIAWRIPKGNFWNAKPVIEDGRVYIASPGTDVFAYCLNEKTGKVIWNGRQYGADIYHIPGAIYTPVVTDKHVLLSTAWWQPQTHFVLNKKNGFFESRIPAGSESGGAPNDVWVYKFNRTQVVLADATSGKEVWKFNTGGFIAGDPVLADDRVYAVGQSGWVFVFNTGQSKPIWQRQLNLDFRGTPGIGKGRIYAGDARRTLHAIDASNGRIAWTFQAPEVENKTYQYFSTAVESNKRVYVGTAGGYVYCLHAGSGSVIWKHRVSDWVRSRPVVLGDMVYVATLDARLYALKDVGDSVVEVWQETLGEHGFTADLVGSANGILASGRDLVLYSLSPETGDLQWKHSIIDGAWVDGVRHRADAYGGQFQTSPVIVDDVVYLGGPDGFLDAVDVNSGKRLWRFETQGRISSAPRVAEGKVFVGKNSHNDEFYAVDQRTGELVWKIENLGWASVGATGYANGRIFVGTVDGKFYGIRAENGHIDWKFDAGNGKGFYPHPATDESMVYTGSHNGNYYAFDQATGKVIWKRRTANPSGKGGLPDSAATVLWKNHMYGQKRGNRIVAIDRKTGREVWEWIQPANYLQNGTVAAFDDKIFGSVVRLVTTIPYFAEIHAFDDVENGGNSLWSYSDGGGGGGLTAPVGTDGKVIFGSSAGVFVTCLASGDGSLIWRCYIGAPMEEGVPAIYGDKVFVHCRNGYFYAIE